MSQQSYTQYGHLATLEDFGYGSTGNEELDQVIVNQLINEISFYNRQNEKDLPPSYIDYSELPNDMTDEALVIYEADFYQQYVDAVLEYSINMKPIDLANSKENTMLMILEAQGMNDPYNARYQVPLTDYNVHNFNVIRDSIAAELKLLQQNQIEANAPDITEEYLPTGDGWERVAVGELPEALTSGNSLALFTKPAEAGFGAEVHAVLTFGNAEDMQRFSALSGEALAAVMQLQDDSLSHSLMLHENGTARTDMTHESSHLTIVVTGDMFGKHMDDPEQLHAALLEHFAPLVGPYSELEVMLRTVTDTPSVEQANEVAPPLAVPMPERNTVLQERQ